MAAYRAPARYTPSPAYGSGWPDRGRTEKLSMSKSKEHMRIQAAVIACQLPDNRAEALLVLDYARHMVVEFWDDSSGVSDSETQPLAPPRARDRFNVH